MQAAIAEGPPDEVGEQTLARMADIPDAHPGAQQAKALLVDAVWRTSPEGQRHYEVLDNMTAVRKAATAVVACVAGVVVGDRKAPAYRALRLIQSYPTLRTTLPRLCNG
jgi:hypothetical protein